MIAAIIEQDVLVIKATITTIFASQVTRFAELQLMYDDYIRFIEERGVTIQ
jgi:hypothetical protein